MMRTFFADLQTADSARFYRAAGQFGDRFMRLRCSTFDCRLNPGAAGGDAGGSHHEE